MEDWTVEPSVCWRFRMDGIERIPGVQASPGVVPFRVTGQQFTKHKILFQYLIPGHAYTFPNDSLSSQELVRTLTQIMEWLLQPLCVLIQFILADDVGRRFLRNVATYLQKYQELCPKKKSSVPFCLRASWSNIPLVSQLISETANEWKPYLATWLIRCSVCNTHTCSLPNVYCSARHPSRTRASTINLMFGTVL